MGVTWKNLLIFGAAVGLAGLWIGNAPADDDALFPMPRGKLFLSECGGCHTAYAPGLLPARSWRKMLSELGNHFGEDASVQEPVRLGLLKDLEDMAADGAYADMRMRRIAASIPANAVPQRIAQTPYFKFIHDEVPRDFWQRKAIGTPANCVACHPRANDGHYGEREVRIPR
jgi:hypothetical protein